MDDRIVYYKGGGTHAERVFCVKCRQHVIMSGPELVHLKSDRWALRGKCPHDGHSIYSFISKARAESLKGS